MPVTLFLNLAVAPYCLSLGKGQQVLDERLKSPAQHYGENLIFDIRDILDAQKVSWSDIHKIFLITGPGNYSGLRISITTAKTIAALCPAKIVPLSTFEALATMLIRVQGLHFVIAPAIRGSLNVQLWVSDGKTGHFITHPFTVKLADLPERLAKFNTPVYLSGIFPQTLAEAPLPEQAILNPLALHFSPILDQDHRAPGHFLEKDYQQIFPQYPYSAVNTATMSK